MTDATAGVFVGLGAGWTFLVMVMCFVGLGWIHSHSPPQPGSLALLYQQVLDAIFIITALFHGIAFVILGGMCWAAITDG